MAKLESTYNMFDLIDQIADTINKMLEENRKERYALGLDPLWLPTNAAARQLPRESH